MNLDSVLRLGVAAMAISAVTACSGAGDPSNQEDDIVAGKSATAYPEAVLVDMLRGGKVVAACSGTLIAPKVVLTAGHCVHGWSAWHVTAPQAGGKVVKAESGATYDWKVEGEIVDPSKHDVGLVFLDSAITLPAYPVLAQKPIAAGERVLNIGRIRDGVLSNSSLFVSKPVVVDEGAPYGLPYDYVAVDAIESGDSGGPDVLPGAAPHTIVAVNSGANGSTEVLARVDLVASWIAAQVAAHSGSKSSGDGKPSAPACAHDACASGGHLAASCDPCVAEVCSGDSFCCAKQWDAQCVAEVETVCGRSCGGAGL